MEKITAYKAENGRIFLTEEECLKYESKIADYPKVSVEKVEIKEGIVKYTELTKKTRWSPTETKVWYIVGGKYKFTNRFRYDMFDYADRVEWFFADAILNDNAEVSCALCHHIFGEMAYDKRYNGQRWGLEDGTIEGKIWRFSDTRWYSGATKPDLIIIEKLEM